MNGGTLVAIDPGASGGIAIAEPSMLAYALKMPVTDGDIVDVLRNVQHRASQNGVPCVCFIEKLPYLGRTPIPAPAMAKLHDNYGFVRGVAQSLGYKLELVAPQHWQKTMMLGTSKGMSRTEWKNKLKGAAQRLYPHLTVTLDTADALLLLECAIRTYKHD